MKNESNKPVESQVNQTGNVQDPDLSQEIAMQPECQSDEGFAERLIGKDTLAIEQLGGRRIG